jgi:hypothetical protein
MRGKVSIILAFGILLTVNGFVLADMKRTAIQPHSPMVISEAL